MQEATWSREKKVVHYSENIGPGYCPYAPLEDKRFEERERESVLSVTGIVGRSAENVRNFT